MTSAWCYNLVLVINDQGNACITIDYIKKKQMDSGVPSSSWRFFYFIILNLVYVLGHEGYSIKSSEKACYKRKREKDKGKGGKEG